MVWLLRAREGAAALAGPTVRGDLARRRTGLPREAARAHGRLDDTADHDRRRRDRRLHRTLAARQDGRAQREARRLANLTGRAVPGPTARNPRLLDRRSAAVAGFAVATVDLELLLHRAAAAVGLAVVAQRRALARDARRERLLDAVANRFDLIVAELARRPERMDLRPPERLVDVDVPQTGERALVEQRRLHRRLAVRELRAQRLRRERAAGRLAAETCREVWIEPFRLDEQPRAEAPYVAVHDIRSVV